MRAEYIVTGDYMYLPVSAGKPERLLEIFQVEPDGIPEKIYEFRVPSDPSDVETYRWDFESPLPVADHVGKKIVMNGDFNDAFFAAVRFGEYESPDVQWRQPVAHAVSACGWTNDPNGMFFDGTHYHLYFQYNPVNVVWRNMSWGHTVSQDLIHWHQKPAVLFPDATGTMFSGCAVRNTRECLDLPKDAVIYFYTAAGDSDTWSRGRKFVQMTAVSTDGGETLQKTGKVCVPMVAKDNRDPKVFYHEASDAYIMVLFLKDHDFAILRSTDLENWEMTQQLTLPEAWECPDLFCLYNDAGEPCWFFWTADGFYWPGSFDGRCFEALGERCEAYMDPLPYAAQTFDGLTGRTVTIPWLRMTNDGRPFTGAYGFPCELGWAWNGSERQMTIRPVRELADHLECLTDSRRIGRSFVHVDFGVEAKALYAKFTCDPDFDGVYNFVINGSRFNYDPASGVLGVDGKKRVVGQGFTKIDLMVDDRILEVWMDDGRAYGAYELMLPNVSLETDGRDFSSYSIYEIQ